MRIGFFDSGLGGLTILRATVSALPQYDYLYYGDTAHVPYGDRPEADIYALTKTGIKWLFENDCLIVIIACNTASAETLRRLQDEWLPQAYPDRRILGVIVPTVEAVLESGCATVHLIATKRTVESQKYAVEFTQRSMESVALTAVATPALVPLIEAVAYERAVEVAVAAVAQSAGETAVILGCTHYTEIKTGLRTQYPTRQIFSQDEIIPGKIRTYLRLHSELDARLTSTGKREVHLTEHRSEYDRLMGQFLGGAFVFTQ